MLRGIIRPGHPINPGHGLARGLIGWWLALPGQARGATWRDLSPLYRAHGTHVNGPAYVPNTRPGGYGVVPNYVGTSNQYTDCSSLDAALANLTQLTISVWTHRTNGSNNGIGNLGSNINIAWYVDNRIYIQIGGVYNYPNASATETGLNHITLTYDGSKSGLARVTLYFNAIPRSLIAGGLDPASSTGSSSGFAVGRFQAASATRYTTGLMDDVAVWSRALSAQEVLAWYRSSLTGHQSLLRRTVLPFKTPSAGYRVWFSSVRGGAMGAGVA